MGHLHRTYIQFFYWSGTEKSGADRTTSNGFTRIPHKSKGLGRSLSRDIELKIVFLVNCSKEIWNTILHYDILWSSPLHFRSWVLVECKTVRLLVCVCVRCVLHGELYVTARMKKCLIRVCGLASAGKKGRRETDGLA